MRNILRLPYGQDVLYSPCEVVTEFGEDLRLLVEEMFQIMYGANGVGLAAPQIGISKQIAVIDISGPNRQTDPWILINPIITSKRGEVTQHEGCLSIPGYTCQKKRATYLTLEYLNIDGQKQDIEASYYLARAIQHEVDHLNGIMIVKKEYIKNIHSIKDKKPTEEVHTGTVTTHDIHQQIANQKGR